MNPKLTTSNGKKNGRLFSCFFVFSCPRKSWSVCFERCLKTKTNYRKHEEFFRDFFAFSFEKLIEFGASDGAIGLWMWNDWNHQHAVHPVAGTKLIESESSSGENSKIFYFSP